MGGLGNQKLQKNNEQASASRREPSIPKLYKDADQIIGKYKTITAKHYTIQWFSKTDPSFLFFHQHIDNKCILKKHVNQKGQKDKKKEKRQERKK